MKSFTATIMWLTTEYSIIEVNSIIHHPNYYMSLIIWFVICPFINVRWLISKKAETMCLTHFANIHVFTILRVFLLYFYYLFMAYSLAFFLKCWYAAHFGGSWETTEAPKGGKCRYAKLCYVISWNLIWYYIVT